MTLPTYLQRFNEIVEGRGWPSTTTPSSILDRWDNFVSDVREGYDGNFDEYWNELSARDLIESLLTDEVVGSTHEVADLRMRVDMADRGLRTMFQEDAQLGEVGQPWWRRGVLRSAGGDYAEDVRRIFGIEVAEV
jgi:hypothetical protein